jgi:thymidylate synthase (FAD)
MNEVKLVGCTVPLMDGVDSISELVAYCARVSNPANQMNKLTAPKLLNYLKENKHWSPFEMVHILMEINTTRDIARQILRHRSFSFQEFSQRYAEVDPSPYLREARLQDTKNRQNSFHTTDEQKKAFFESYQNRVWESAWSAYKWALDNGIAKEQARAVLPEGMTPSRMYMGGTLRSWLHYIELRTGNGTQAEHQYIAQKCADIIEELLNDNKEDSNKETCGNCETCKCGDISFDNGPVNSQGC